MDAVKFIQVGFGPIGQQVVRYALEKSNLDLDAVVDIDKEKAGRDAGEIIGSEKIGVKVVGNLERALEHSSAEVVVISTLSSFKSISDQITTCVKYGKNVVSTCEELLYPWVNDKDLADEIDRFAKEKNVSVLGTGVNPGLLMDLLPLVLSAACRRVDRVVVKRYQDASKRRLPFQKKIGAELSLKEFERLRDEGLIRHVGFKESINLIAKGFGWQLDRIEETVDPVIAESDVSSEFIQVKEGYVKGVRQIARGFKKGEEVIRLELLAYLGNKNCEDTVEIYGEPDIKNTIEGGVNGDIATAAVVVNIIPGIVEALPGLRTMIDIPSVHFQE